MSASEEDRSDNEQKVSFRGKKVKISRLRKKVTFKPRIIGIVLINLSIIIMLLIIVLLIIILV